MSGMNVSAAEPEEPSRSARVSLRSARSDKKDPFSWSVRLWEVASHTLHFKRKN